GCRTRPRSTVRASGWGRSREMLFLLRLKVSKKSESSPSANGGTYRPTSPCEAGSSILITSAPRSASWSVPHGPAPYCSSAITRTSASGCVGHLRQPVRVVELEDVEDDVAGTGGHVLAHARRTLFRGSRHAIAVDDVLAEVARVA